MNDTQAVIPPLPPRWAGVAERGQSIYNETIRPHLTDADKGKYLIIDVETGEWVLGEDDEKASHEARERFGKRLKYGMRIGHRAMHSFRPGMNTELAEW